MVANKKPTRNVARKAKASAEDAPAKIMGNQDTKSKGDSRAERTARTSFSTTPEILDKLTDEAYERRMPRSQLIEEAIVSYLKL